MVASWRRGDATTPQHPIPTVYRFRARIDTRHLARDGLRLAVALLAALAATTGRSQTAETEPTVRQSGHGVHETVRLVLLSTTVTTRKGRPVKGLSSEDFVLHDDGEPRSIEFFATENDVPMSIAFLLDVSGSMAMRGRLEDSKQAIGRFVKALGPDDRAGLIGFADEQVTWITGFTSDRRRFLRRLAVQEALGPTALYDALAASPTMVDERVRGRRAIVLLTDGLDNASRLTNLEAIWIARRVRVPIYILDFLWTDPSRLPRRERQSLRVLRRFAAETGGVVHAVHTERQLEAAIEAILDDLRFQYVIGFTPGEDSEGAPDLFRRVRLEARRPNLRVRTRSGYYPGR